MLVRKLLKPLAAGATTTVLLLSLAGCDRSKPEKLTNQGPTIKLSQDAAAGPDNPVGDTSTPANPTADGQTESTPTAQTPPGTVASITAEPAPDNGSPAAPQSFDKVDISDRTFMTLQPIKSEEPADLVSHLTAIDEAIRDLILAGSNNIVGADTFNSSGMRLGQMKLTTGEKLASLPTATEEQRKLGTVAQLVALSHMSGLKDIESAKKLEKFASTLLQSSDPDLAHQGRVVLLGFRLQDLQNGTVSDPTQLIATYKGSSSVLQTQASLK